ncbi:ABC transporter substrate-binding protein [Bacillus sp. FJAT-42376]|uniref:ABC transporter substrate-binding protein n=1 Tax=Bacillus sp. FJAT-42376 TaxID=2014076 RepID=UPI000F4E3B56|nr:ABC transporter substrate-binding protein [Bacillus sp. FJAT-42376]AZB42673.1 ABC transporter substrate-binding protein [Bacillus sp. FJAT-42376]
MNRLFSIFTVLLLTAGIISGCGQDSAAPEQMNEKQTAQSEKAEFPVKIKDASGKEVTIEKEPGKIVSLIPSNTEILFAMGLGDKVIGVTDNDNYPEEAVKKEKVGGMDFNVEKIIGLQPDLVLAHESGAHNSADGLKQLEDAGIKVILIKDAQSFDKVYESIDMIGQATGEREESGKIVEGMKKKLAEIKEKASAIPEDQRKSVFAEVSPSPEIYTAGKDTFLNDILTTVGAKNAAAGQSGWPKMSEEAIVKLNPDVIVTTYGYYSPNPVEQVMSRKGWESVTAIKEKAVFDVHSDKVTRPGPRLIEGVEELANAIYPDVFTK